jgi:hypothetical protein
MPYKKIDHKALKRQQEDLFFKALAAPTTTGKARHKDGYVVVKLSHPKHNFREQTFRYPDCDQNLGFIPKVPSKNRKVIVMREKKFRRWSNNPKTMGRKLTTVPDIELNEIAQPPRQLEGE